MFIKIILTFIFLSLLNTVAFAENIIGGIDLDTYDWEKICKDIEPIPLNTPKLNCEYSHPASSYHNYKTITIAEEYFPGAINCEYLKSEYDFLVAPLKEAKNAEYKVCYRKFEIALRTRIKYPENYYYDLQSWVNHVFK